MKYNLSINLLEKYLLLTCLQIPLNLFNKIYKDTKHR